MAGADVRPAARWNARTGGEGSAAFVARLASGLCLAATPTFALMALLAGLHQGPMDRLCSAAGMPLGGMIPMYLLMSAFHAPAWLKLVWVGLMSNRRSVVGPF
jgi:hypothetical protein